MLTAAINVRIGERQTFGVAVLGSAPDPKATIETYDF
jgi:hypothetical protein